MAKPCTTHHFACDCREAWFRDFIQQAKYANIEPAISVKKKSASAVMYRRCAKRLENMTQR